MSLSGLGDSYEGEVDSILQAELTWGWVGWGPAPHTQGRDWGSEAPSLVPEGRVGTMWDQSRASQEGGRGPRPPSSLFEGRTPPCLNTCTGPVCPRDKPQTSSLDGARPAWPGRFPRAGQPDSLGESPLPPAP